ncbi:ROK family protein [Sediminispirochaeta smaragdinae]|uniref:ROK family protein n=1 Tax=Sediminispirochaeta smaragdinae (strain DSM 11293 / JCM 15392 / SEBR 4228) TaxID=573413 RepID=E1RC72_SEDSS|nr:ROK family protein [Sediminispirochaeta smaragdinae]ADK79952.1 ROK family protein [Sediminispirochaeta smaragdinae DSM 11293]
MTDEDFAASIQGQCLIVMDIGGTRIRIASIEVSEKEVPYAFEEYSSNLLQETDPIEILRGLLNQYTERNGIHPAAVIIGVPAIIDEDKDYIIQCNNITSLNGRKIASELRVKIGIPVYVDHDTKLLLHGEKAGKTLEDNWVLLGIFFGTGIGADVLLHDKACRLYRNGLELGHIPFRLNGKKCVCGRHGCAEAYVNGRVLEEISEDAHIHISKVFQLWGEDSIAGKRLKEFVDNEALLVTTAITIIEPTHVIIGGGIAAMECYPKGYLEEFVKRQACTTSINENCIISWAERGDMAGFHGGVSIFKERAATEKKI